MNEDVAVSFVKKSMDGSTFYFKTTNHRVLLPGAALCGVALALLGGLFPASVPLNAVLSLVGVPVIMWVLVRGSGARF